MEMATRQEMYESLSSSVFNYYYYFHGSFPFPQPVGIVGLEVHLPAHPPLWIATFYSAVFPRDVCRAKKPSFGYPQTTARRRKEREAEKKKKPLLLIHSARQTDAPLTKSYSSYSYVRNSNIIIATF